jgi:hypothetical protein
MGFPSFEMLQADCTIPLPVMDELSIHTKHGLGSTWLPSLMQKHVPRDLWNAEKSRSWVAWRSCTTQSRQLEYVRPLGVPWFGRMAPVVAIGEA